MRPYLIENDPRGNVQAPLFWCVPPDHRRGRLGETASLPQANLAGAVGNFPVGLLKKGRIGLPMVVGECMEDAGFPPLSRRRRTCPPGAFPPPAPVQKILARYAPESRAARVFSYPA